MKRKMAMLLAAALTLSTIPATGAMAADTVGPVEPGMELEEELPEEFMPGEEPVAAEEVPSGTEEEPADAGQTVDFSTEVEEAEEGSEEDEDVLEVEEGIEATGLIEEKISGWAKDLEGRSIYRNDDGTLASGWKEVSGDWYFFDPSNNGMVTGWQLAGNKWYFLDKETGVMQTGWYTGLGNGAENTYYLTESGAMWTGWGKIDGNWYYFGEQSGALKFGWQKIRGKWYFFDEETGVMQTGWMDKDGKTYFLSDSGVMWTGWGQIDGKWYYFNPSGGAMKTGWTYAGGKWYYLDEESANPKTGWMKENGKWYYFAGSGAMWTGWGQIDGKWYYFNQSGVMQKEWTKAGSSWYYIGTDGVMRTGWQKVGNLWYYLDPSSGIMHKGPTFIGKTLWYLNSNGGWLQDHHKGWKKLEDTNKWYYVYDDGHCAVNTTINGYVIENDGVWYEDPLAAEASKYTSPTKYLIVADRREHWLAVFEATQKQGSRYSGWTKIKGNWRITTGSEETPTPLGEHWVHFKDDSPYGWQGFTESKAAWCSYITGGFYIHSILYVKNYSYNVSPSYTPVLDADLGENLSHSCIRLKTENAKWVYDNIPEETKVIVFESNGDYEYED